MDAPKKINQASTLGLAVLTAGSRRLCALSGVLRLPSSKVPSDVPTEVPSLAPSETSSEAPSEAPSETPSETPSEPRRFLLIRFGAAEVGMSSRWRGHEKASKLETAQDRKSRFYTRYPHKDFLHNDPSRLRKGLFQDLQQFVGIGFKRDNKENIVNLFDWDNGEVKEFEKLRAASESRNTLVDKKCRHLKKKT
jgi:hypothetical protein